MLNFTNHSSANWDQKQKQMAIELYQEIIDIPFPEIDPSGDEEYIEQLANQYLQKILDIKNQYPNVTLTVHIMGELTFCFSLIKKLQQHGISCVASTTQRIVEITPDNKKISKFNFVKFRRY